jgi:hypothetical protein
MRRSIISLQMVKVIIAALLMGGCTGVREAREVARVSLAETITYEQQVQEKIKGESAFYTDRVAHLKRDATALKGDSERTLLTRAAQDFQNRIQSSNTPTTDTIIRDEVDHFLDILVRSQAYSQAMIAGFSTNLLSSVESLELQKAALERTRKGLEELQREPGTIDQLKRLFEFGKKTKEEYEKAVKAGAK